MLDRRGVRVVDAERGVRSGRRDRRRLVVHLVHAYVKDVAEHGGFFGQRAFEVYGESVGGQWFGIKRLRIVRHTYEAGDSLLDRARLRLRVPETFGDCPEQRTVVSTGLFCKPKQGEEDQGATGENPASQLSRDVEGTVRAPYESGNLLNLPELVVGVCPGNPGVHADAVVVDPHIQNSERNVACHVDARQ